MEIIEIENNSHLAHEIVIDLEKSSLVSPSPDQGVTCSAKHWKNGLCIAEGRRPDGLLPPALLRISANELPGHPAQMDHARKLLSTHGIEPGNKYRYSQIQVALEVILKSRPDHSLFLPAVIKFDKGELDVESFRSAFQIQKNIIDIPIPADTKQYDSGTMTFTIQAYTKIIFTLFRTAERVPLPSANPLLSSSAQ